MNEENSVLSRTLPLVIALSGAIALPVRAADPASAELPAQPRSPAQPPPLSELMGEAPATPAPAAAAPSPSASVTLNLIHRLVRKGVLSQEDATDLIRQAEADAAAAGAREAADGPLPADDDVRVTYVPENVKSEIRQQVQEDVMSRARSEHWTAPDPVPAWTTRIHPFGDFRGRYESLFFPVGNENTGAFPNFNAINTGSAPFDVSGSLFSPQLNVDRNRERERIRVRFGADVDLQDRFTAGVRLATGDSASPVSTNQSLGTNGGNFSKYTIWLDRAFLRYDAAWSDSGSLALFAGRFENPFLSTEAVWDDDLGFDGLAAKGRWKINDRVSPFFAAGAFPVFNTDLNFGSNNPAKFKSTDKYLYGAQLGVEWKIRNDLTAKGAVAFYDFDNAAGKLSSPFTPLTPQDAGDTDTTRPSFAQKGNTYMALRNIVNNTSNDNGAKYQYQYYGLATPFRDVAATGRLDYTGYEPVQLSLVGEYIQNTAFDKAAVTARAVNNLSDGGAYVGGDKAWLVAFQIGRPAMEQWGDWTASLGYRHVESDAVVDGFNDSDFGGGGTNMEGLTLGGTFALTRNVRLGARWMSATQIAGPTLKSDAVQFDLHAKF